jgi:predicted MFS family arabinose efflux permease
LGGWIVDHFSWRWIFFVNPVLTLPTVLVALYHVPESRDPEAKPGLDWKGALLVLIGLGSITYGLIALPLLKWSDPIVLGSLSVGLVLLGAFVWVEGHSRAPMLPLTMFRSRAFSVINILTLLLYGALGGTFFFLPFALIQVRGYPGAFAGAAFLPFTIIMAGLSRWAGGLLDSFGASSALGLGLIASMVVNGPYWEFFIPIIILGFGMVISVAPLTTTVMNSVPANQTGTASGINNAVASVANLFAVAILGAVALGILNHALDQRLQGATLSRGVQQAIQAAHGSFVIEPALSNARGADRLAAEVVIKGSLAEGIRSVMLIAAVLALSAAAAGTLLPRSIEITDPNGS